jgi:2-C-methyl-D-erythritol 4-phosphate cytidylyltransferase
MALALIVAAGSGERLGASQPKALVALAGRPLYEWSLLALRQVRGIEQIVIAMPPSHSDAASGWEFAAQSLPPVLAVAGGQTRSESVLLALAAAGPGDPVLVHDAARPLLTPELAREVIDALAADASADAAIAAMPVTDTVKRVDGGGAVHETLDRDELWAVQTPQVFRRAALERALEVPAHELARATDDAWLIERDGGRVIVVRASDENLKVTTPLDLRVAELLLAGRAVALEEPESAGGGRESS